MILTAMRELDQEQRDKRDRAIRSHERFSTWLRAREGKDGTKPVTKERYVPDEVRNSKIISNADLSKELQSFLAQHPGISPHDIDVEAGINDGYTASVVRRTYKRMRDGYAKLIRRAMASLSNQSTAHTTTIQQEPVREMLAKQGDDRLEMLGRQWHPICEVIERFQATKKQMDIWLKGKCPEKHKLQHLGKWYVHHDAFFLLARYAAAHKWDEQKPKRMGFIRKLRRSWKAFRVTWGFDE